jgi:hypothetical protein
MRWIWGVSGLVVTMGVFASCSTPSPCEVPPGTPISTLDAEFVTSGYPDIGPDGPIPGSFRFCCVGGPADPFPDGGCGESCDGQPRVDVYTRLYGGECFADLKGRIQCSYYVMDGGVVASGENCLD